MKHLTIAIVTPHLSQSIELLEHIKVMERHNFTQVSEHLAARTDYSFDAILRGRIEQISHSRPQESFYSVGTRYLFAGNTTYRIYTANSLGLMGASFDQVILMGDLPSHTLKVIRECMLKSQTPEEFQVISGREILSVPLRSNNKKHNR